MHRYYDFMPDLNITDPDVLDEMHKVLGLWLELGISGFRVDSLPFMIETIGTSARRRTTRTRSPRRHRERRSGPLKPPEHNIPDREVPLRGLGGPDANTLSPRSVGS